MSMDGKGDVTENRGYMLKKNSLKVRLENSRGADLDIWENAVYFMFSLLVPSASGSSQEMLN